MSVVLKCTSCGEEIFYPIFYDGGAYGSTCIKKVIPNYKSKKSNYVPYFVPADNYELDVIEESKKHKIIKVTATSNFVKNSLGNLIKFSDTLTTVRMINGVLNTHHNSNFIEVVEDKVYIDLNRSKHNSNRIESYLLNIKTRNDDK